MNKLFLCAAALCAASLISCKETDGEKSDQDKNVQNVEIADSSAIDSNDVRVQFDELFASVPSPYVMSRMLESAGVQASPKMLHAPEASTKYNSQRGMGLNLGIYMVDLNYAHVMALSTDEIEYMAAILGLSDELGLNKVFDENLIEDMRSNIQDRTYVMQTITDTYATLEGYLIEEGREEVAAYMMAGSVVEVIFLGTQVATEHEVLLQAMADQSSGVQAIIDIIHRMGETDEQEPVLEDLTRIMAVFNKMETQGEKSSVERADDGTVTLGSVPRRVLTPELAEELHVIVNEIRGRYINEL